MRHRWIVAAYLAVGLVATACGDDAESGSTADEEATVAETTAPADDTTQPDDETEQEEEPADDVSGGTMVVAISEDPGHFNPGITTGFNVHVVTGSMFNGLVELDDNANPLPDLAESWEVSDDATTYTFTLADGVTWHDGEPFTSADVKFTFEEVLLNFHSRTKSGLEGALASIDTPDDQTVVFTFSEPYAALLQRLNSTEAPILAQHIYGGVDDVQEAAENLTPVGTGPFMFESHEIDSEVRLVRNPNYFKDGLPLLDEVVYRVIPDANTQLLALEQGEIDYLWRVPGAELERLGGDDAIDLYPVNSGPGGGFCVPTLTFNLDREVFDDIRVRQAIAHAIDRQQLVDQAIFGQGRAATGPISSEMAFAYTDDVTEYPRDIERANALLDDAGFSAEGTRFTIDLLHFPNFSKYGEIIRENLSEVGIDVELAPLDRAAFLPRVFEQRDFDTNVISYCNNSDPSIGVSRMYLSTNIGNIPFSNGAGYVNPTIDELFADGNRTADTGARADIYAEIQQILVDELPYWWLVETRFTVGATAGMEGLAPHSGHFAEGAHFVDG